MNGEFKYDAFISYSHDDAELAKRIARRIRWYRAPRQLKLPHRKLAVFLDVELLTASPDVSEELSQRVEGARKMALLCSPSSAASDYVDHEVATFLSMRDKQSLLVVLCDGDPSTSFPPSLRAAVDEPLYIDLRRRPGFWARWGAFRRESLRLIAAVLEVDYSELRREDESRRRRRRNLAVFATVLLLFAAGSAFLIRSVPADSWDPVSLPEFHWDSPVMPIKNFAVQRSDPSVLLFEVHDAYHVSQRPDNEFMLELVTSPVDLAEFQAQTVRHLASIRDLDDVPKPVAILKFDVMGENRPRASAEMRVYGFLGPEGEAWFSRAFKFIDHSKDEDANTLLLPPGEASVTSSPFEMQPWPIDPLLAFSSAPFRGDVEATVENLLDRSTTTATYSLVDLEESFIEFNDGMLFERAIISNRSDLEIEIDGTKEPLDAIESEITWAEVAKWKNWVAYVPPQAVRFADLFLYIERGADDSREARLSLLAEKVGGRKSIAGLLLDSGLALDEPETGITATLLSREGADPLFEFLSVRAAHFDEIASKITKEETACYFKVGAAGEWKPVNSAALSPKSVIHDVIPIGAGGDQYIAVLEPGGLIHSRDGGASWNNFNLGNAAIESARKLYVVSAGDDPVLTGTYVLAYDYTEDSGRGDSRLFKYHRQSWVERWRAGLVRLLRK